MPSVTTQELIDRARAISDSRDNFVTPTQWMLWASQERLSLDLFLARSGWSIAATTLDIVVNGTENGAYNVAPSTGVMAIVCVHQVRDNRYRRLTYQDSVTFLHQTPGSVTPQSGARGCAVNFRAGWTGDTLILNMYPEPIVGETYRVTYCPHPARLSLDAVPATNYANTVAYPMGWEERIVLGMARRALIKEESSTQAVDTELQLWEMRIEEACWGRVLASAPTIRNVDADERGWTDRMTWPVPLSWYWA